MGGSLSLLNTLLDTRSCGRHGYMMLCCAKCESEAKVCAGCAKMQKRREEESELSLTEENYGHTL